MKLSTLFTFLILIGSSLAGCAATTTGPTWNARTKTAIVLPQNATLPEQTAARELKEYLTKITGGEFTIQKENAGSTPSAIYVGNTNFAKRAGVDASTLPSEAWRIKTRDGRLILAGGGTRGTLYATYHFLEDVAGVRWWTPWEEFVPARQVLTVPELDASGKPAFAYRDIYMLYGNDDGRFMARSRLNREGDAGVSAAYGGTLNYGPPYHVHTFFKYLPPEKYFKEHPDWYLVPGGGAPTVHNAQLCLSNREMRAEFLKVLRDNIRTSRQAALEKQLPPPAVYSVSQNDNRIGFVCGDNKELVEREGSEAAALLDFINYLADGIRDEFPGVYIDTLAYFSGEPAPKTLNARDNVIVRLTDTQSNVLLPVTAERNRVMRENLEAWARRCKNLRVWDYNITFKFPAVPTPTLTTYAPDLRFFRQHNVEGMFIEFERPLSADLRDMKLWILCKLLEDPTQNVEALEREFTSGYYGPAAPMVREYLAALRDAARKSDADVEWFSSLGRFSYLTPEFLRQANAIYDRAAAAVAKDPVYSRRVRRARFAVDDALLRRLPDFMLNWVRAGHKPEEFAWDRDEVAARYLQTQTEQIDLQLPADKRAAALKEVSDEVARWTAGPLYTPPPAKFRDVPLTHVTTYGALNTRNYQNRAKSVKDAHAESGLATRYEIPADELEKYKLPMPWGIYDTKSKKELLNKNITAEDVPGPGYHWYKMGEVTLQNNAAYLYFFRSWIIQIDLDSVFDEAKPEQKFEVWANLKFEGPAFPHGKAGEKNAISVERVVLVKK